jgi:hypothetical protein
MAGRSVLIRKIHRDFGSDKQEWREQVGLRTVVTDHDSSMTMALIGDEHFALGQCGHWSTRSWASRLAVTCTTSFNIRRAMASIIQTGSDQQMSLSSLLSVDALQRYGLW